MLHVSVTVSLLQKKYGHSNKIMNTEKVKIIFHIITVAILLIWEND